MTTKADCLRYPGQPDTHTRAELIEYFEKLAAKAADRERVQEDTETFLGGSFPQLKLAKPELKTKVTDSGNTLYSYGVCGVWFSTEKAARQALS